MEETRGIAWCLEEENSGNLRKRRTTVACKNVRGNTEAAGLGRCGTRGKGVDGVRL